MGLEKLRQNCTLDADTDIKHHSVFDIKRINGYLPIHPRVTVDVVPGL